MLACVCPQQEPPLKNCCKNNEEIQINRWPHTHSLIKLMHILQTSTITNVCLWPCFISQTTLEMPRPNVLTLLVKCILWSSLCNKYKNTHTHTQMPDNINKGTTWLENHLKKPVKQNILGLSGTICCSSHIIQWRHPHANTNRAP